MFVTCILQVDTTRNFFLDQLEVSLAKFKIWIRKYRPRKLGQLIDLLINYLHERLYKRPYKRPYKYLHAARGPV